jgi:hypothetical protein
MRLTEAEFPTLCRVLDMLDFDAGGDLSDPDRSIPAEWQAQLPAVERVLRPLGDEQLERFVCSTDDGTEHYQPEMRVARQFIRSYREGWVFAPNALAIGPEVLDG